MADDDAGPGREIRGPSWRRDQTRVFAAKTAMRNGYDITNMLADGNELS
jgi:hypothetical protein